MFCYDDTVENSKYKITVLTHKASGSQVDSSVAVFIGHLLDDKFNMTVSRNYASQTPKVMLRVKRKLIYQSGILMVLALPITRHFCMGQKQQTKNETLFYSSGLNKNHTKITETSIIR